jgi:sec-independent protein translocase protein TatC
VTTPETAVAPPAPLGGSPVSGDESAVMPLVDHLSELRNRVIKSLLAVGLGSIVGFYYNEQIRDLLLSPLPNAQVQVLAPGDAFSITLRIAIITGVILAMPVILYQAWAFVSPGLTAVERRAIRPWIPLALLFFALGVGVAWLVMPVAVGFLLSFTDESLRADLAAEPYFNFVGSLFLAFGVAMQYPIVLLALARVGILSSAQLRAWRRYVLLLVFVVATALTPPDAFSDIVLGLIMYGLYEVTIFVVTRMGR